MQRSGETSGIASIQAAGSPTGHTDALPYHLLHQSSGTSAASGMTEHQTGLRHVNTRKRVTCFTAASPRQALDPGSCRAGVQSCVRRLKYRPPALHVVTSACPSRESCYTLVGQCHSCASSTLDRLLMLYHNPCAVSSMA